MLWMEENMSAENKKVPMSDNGKEEKINKLYKINLKAK